MMRTALAIIAMAGLVFGQDAAPGTLEYAVMHRQAFVVGRLLMGGANPNRVGANGTTPLADAALKGDVDIVQVLLRYGAKPDIVSKDGTLPIHDAALGGHPQVIQDLLIKGAKIDSRTWNDGATPLQIAAENGKFKAVQMLLGYGADPTIKDVKGRTALDLAERAGEKDISELLKKALADRK